MPSDSATAEGPRRVGVLVYPDVEDLDFIGPLEVFGMAGRLRKGALEVLTIAETMTPVRTSFGVTVTPHCSFETAPPIDILVVPGGGGAWASLEDQRLLGWLARTAKNAEITTSVCSGAMLLAVAGVLRHQPATTHWNAMARMRERFPDIELRAGVRWVDEGGVVTSAGVSAGIDMALHVVERLFGQETADLTAHWLQYDPWGAARARTATAVR